MSGNDREMMEQRLQRLVRAVEAENRTRWAEDWKLHGGKVVGVLCSYVPEEVLHAAGVLPWRVVGSWQADSYLAQLHWPRVGCPYVNNVLEALLSGDLTFLDGIVATNRDQELVRLWDVWSTMVEPSGIAHILHVPRKNAPYAVDAFRAEIASLMQVVQSFAQREITQDALCRSVELYNRVRTLLTKVYELRRRATPPLSGAEALGLVMASTLMPKETFVEEMEALLGYLGGREAPVPSVKPRLLVSSDILDNPAFLRIVEEAGALVAMDDMDPGSRYFWRTTDTTADDLLDALAQRYLMRPLSPRMFGWETQAQQVVDWVREYDCDGVVHLPLLYSRAREIYFPTLARALKQADIPFLSAAVGYAYGNVGQLRTRCEAFVEVLRRKAA